MTRPRKKVSNTSLAYQDIGKGHVVFCLPGFPTSSEVFTIIAKKLEKNARFISIDFPGWGGQSDHSQDYLTIETLAQLMAKFINSFNIEKYSILGYSLGTMIVQEMIRKNLIDPYKVIFLSPITNFNWTGLPVLAKGLFHINRICTTIKWYPRIFYQTRYYLLKKVGQRLKDKQMGKEYYETSQVLEQEVEQTNLAIACHTIVNVHEQDFVLPNIMKKTLVVYGSDDYSLIQVAVKNLQTLPYAQVEKIHDAGHYCLWTHTSKMVKIMKKFLNEE